MPQPWQPRAAWSPLFVKGFHRSLEFDQQGLTLAVKRLACGHFDPAFADAIFFNVGQVLAVQADADVMFKRGRKVVGAARIHG
jgi:hypothetical protein